MMIGEIALTMMIQEMMMTKMEYTKYEHARIVGARALQLSQGAPLMIKLTEQDLKDINYNPVEIAKREFAQGVIPIDVKRHLPMKKESVAKSFDQTKLE